MKRVRRLQKAAKARIVVGRKNERTKNGLALPGGSTYTIAIENYHPGWNCKDGLRSGLRVNAQAAPYIATVVYGYVNGICADP